MRFITPARAAPGVVALVGCLGLALWLVDSRPPARLQERVPGTDLAGHAGPAPTHVRLSGAFVKSTGAPADLPGAWPQLRGPNGDDISPETTPLADHWPASGPPCLWSVDLGEGYAGAAVLNGRVYVLDYDQVAGADALRCVSLADGKEIWRRSYLVKVKRNHGMSRTVPAVTSKYVVSLGPKCQVICVDAVKGDFKWGIDLVNEYHTRVPPWYAGQCPIIDHDRAILAPGGLSLMIAVDCATGQVIWKTPNPHLWPMSHSSVVPMTFAGKKMYVYCASGGVVGVDAANGQILWETDQWKVNIATVPSPVVVGDGRIFLSGGYDAGSMMLQLKNDNGKITPEVEYRLKPEQFGSAQQTPVFYQGYIYGVIPSGQLVCMDLSGRKVWDSGSDRFGLGPYLVADGMIYAMNDIGLLSLVKANPQSYARLAQAKVLAGHDSWGPMALVGGRLIARDLTRMVCLDVRK